MTNKYRVTVLIGYSGKVAERYFNTKSKMLKYVSKVVTHASEVSIISRKKKDIDRISQKSYSKVDWA